MEASVGCQGPPGLLGDLPLQRLVLRRLVSQPLRSLRFPLRTLTAWCQVVAYKKTFLEKGHRREETPTDHRQTRHTQTRRDTHRHLKSKADTSRYRQDTHRHDTDTKRHPQTGKTHTDTKRHPQTFEDKGRHKQIQTMPL